MQIRNTQPPIQTLLSLPPGSVRNVTELVNLANGSWFVASDPVGRKLGSGGGTAHLLAEAWQATGDGQDFSAWLRANRKLLIHGGGQSRRLPAYAALGKPLIPVPVMRWSYGQRLDQTLVDLQLPGYRRVFARATNAALMIASGDVFLRFGKYLPPLPEADVIAVGMRVDAETAQNFGVFFTDRKDPQRLIHCLQKPGVEQIRELARRHPFFVDTGLWLLSERAVLLLMERCGWDAAQQRFVNGAAEHYEFYAHFGLALGETPQIDDPALNTLSCAIATLPQTEFYHLGTSRQLIQSIAALQDHPDHNDRFAIPRTVSDQIIQNAFVDPQTRRKANTSLWIENAHVPASWRLSREHVLTGVPANDWNLCLPPGICLDFAPVDTEGVCVRPYALDDTFSGALGSKNTLWCGQPFAFWLAARGLTWEGAGLDPSTDIYSAPLFPIIRPETLDPAFVEWLFLEEPPREEAHARQWLTDPRLSAEGIAQRLDVPRLVAQRAENRREALQTLHAHRTSSVFYRLDLAATATIQEQVRTLPSPDGSTDSDNPMAKVYDHTWRAAVLRQRGEAGYEDEQEHAFASLREAILRETFNERLAAPTCCVQEDQIVWGRAPVRLDLAGGWTDTPPYCLQHGGRVTNMAVDLNGQPPIQVFVKVSRRPGIVIRSIDLGVEQVVTEYEQVERYAEPGNEFALAKAALALAGFLPGFHAEGAYRSLTDQLEAFGGGLEISLLAAVPKGSGLGTSSILAATLLGTLSEVCGLNWDRNALIGKTLALEQMLTTGGGWQDQAGGILRGVKLIETLPGASQTPTLRWLPEYLLRESIANRGLLLYYTGLTRLAKSILHEIVQNMFLNAATTLDILQDIGDNAYFARDAIQSAQWETLCEAVRRSWQLNRRLDTGTNPPAVQAILSQVQDYLSACKLLGAGGGGYLLMFAKDAEAAQRIRRTLLDNPPNPRARFVEMSISQTGLEITRS